MVTIYWAVTPLVSSMFLKTVVVRSIITTARTTASLAPVEEQISMLNTGFMRTAYGWLFLDQELPAFVRADGAILPFTMENVPLESLNNETWTAKTTMYTTTLDCQPSIINSPPPFAPNSSKMHASHWDEMSYSNGKGCTTNGPDISGPDLVSQTFVAGLYLGFYSPSYIQSSGTGCQDANTSHTFLAFCGVDLASPSPNFTALFCEPAYWSQPVNATVASSDMSVLDVVPLAPPEPLTQEVFNNTNFEYVVGTGTSNSLQKSDISQVSYTTYHELQLSGERYLDQNLGSVSNMISFALGFSRLGLDEYTNATLLASSLESAQKLLFALAVSSLLSTNVSNADSGIGTIEGSTNAVVVVNVLAVIVEVFLGLVVFSTLVLLYASWSRGIRLREDPASLTNVMKMIMPNVSSSTSIQTASAANDRELRISIVDGKLHMSRNLTDLERSGTEQRNTRLSYEGTIRSEAPVRNSETCNFVRPREMNLAVGFAFITVLLLAVTTLVVLYIKVKDHGLYLPSDSPIMIQVVLNFIPTVFATFLEPFWTVLNRLICVLQPFESLRTARAKASESLDVKYVSLPPQLVILRALRARHFLLATVCGISISANVLAVAFSGLFTTSIVNLELPGTFNSPYLPITNGSSLYDTSFVSNDYLYAAQANFTNTTALPAWVTRDRFFVPFSLNSSTEFGNIQLYRATTYGFGVDVQCRQADLDTAVFVGKNVAIDKPALILQDSTGGAVTCGNVDGAPLEKDKPIAATEVLTSIGGSFDWEHTEELPQLCKNIMLTGFLRANLTASHSTAQSNMFSKNSALEMNSLSSLWLVCRPTLLVAPYEILVDRRGRVQNYTRKAPYSTDLDPFFPAGHNSTRFLSAIGEILTGPQGVGPQWHNDTFVYTWFSSFIKALTNSSDAVDPSLPVPSYDFIAPVIEDMCTRLFAILLGLHPKWFVPAPPGSTVPGTILVAHERVFMSQLMFIVALTLLSLNVVVAITYYAKRPKPILQRMPDTVASVLALFDGSGLVAKKEQEEWPEDWRFGYGKFVGTDGKPHLGIERKPFVIPLDA